MQLPFIGVGRCFNLGGEGGATKFLYNKYRLGNTSLTAIHNITSYVKVPKLGGGASRPPPPRFLRLYPLRGMAGSRELPDKEEMTGKNVDVINQQLWLLL